MMKNLQILIGKLLLTSIMLVLFGSYVTAQSDISSQYTFKQVKTGGGGFVTGLTINPNFDNVAYCRTDVGGAYKFNFTTNKWEQLVTASRMPSSWVDVAETGGTGNGVRRRGAYNVTAIATDPNNASVFYMINDGGLFKSTNGGSTFTWLQGFTVSTKGNDHSGERTCGERLQIDPFNSNNLLFGSQFSGLYKSTNGGTNWSSVSTLPVNTTGGVLWIQYDKNTSGRVYAAVKGYGVYRSNDGGNTWSIIKSSTNLCRDGQIVNGLLWFAILNDGIYKYDGSTLTKTSSQNAEDLAVDPNNNQVVYALSEGFNNNSSLKRTINGGTNWTDMTRNIYSSIGWKAGADFVQAGGWLSIGDITIDPRNSGRMWFAEGMGMWRANISNTINNPQFVDISDGIEELVSTDIVSSHNGRFTVSCWDRVGLEFSNPDQFSAQQASANSSLFSGGSSVASSPTDPNFVIITSSDFIRAGSGNVLNFSASSTDGGSNWTKFGSVNSSWQNNPSDLVAGEGVVSANNNANLVWVPRNGTNNKIYYSTNTGSSWTSATISGYANSNGSYLTAKKVLCADAVTSGKFYVYNWTAGNVFVSINGGANWTAKAAGLPTYCWHPQLKYAPGKAGHIWFASGWDYAAQPGLWYSTNSGDAFTKVSAVQECWAVGFGKEASGATYPTIYIYGKINNAWGMYRSTDQAASWSKIVDYPLGLFDQINAIEGDVDVFGKVYVGFGGNGWAYGVISGSSVPVTGVTVNPTSATVNVGSTTTITATVAPANATNQNVSWSTSNASVATVNSSGVVTGVASGSATITVTTQDGNKTATCAITVSSVNVPVTGVTVNPTSASVNVGSTTTITATVAPANATNKNVTWSSNNTSVATVSSGGVVTGVAAGSATITVTTQDGNKTATCAVTVSSGSSSTTYQGENYTSQSGVVVATNQPDYTGTGFADFGGNGTWLEWNNVYAASAVTGATLTFRYANGSTTSRQCALTVNGVNVGNITLSVTGSWATWNTEVKTVNLNAGNNTIRVTANTSNGGPNLDKMDVAGGGSSVAVTGVSVSPTTASISVGATTTLTATVAPSTATNKTVSWSTSNASVATVNSSGLVTGVAAGSANITVTTQDGNKTAVCAVTVNAPSALTKYEAENATLTGVTVASSTSGYSGTGYTDAGSLDVNGDQIRFTVNVASAGQYPLVIRYGGFNGDKQQNVIINSAAAVSTSFPSTTVWTDLNYGDVTLNAGNNTITIAKNWGWTAFDYITIGELQKSASVATEVLSINTIALPSVTLYPNPVTNKQLNLTFSNLIANELYVVRMIDITGKLLYVTDLQSEGDATLSIDCSTISKGLYFVKMNGCGLDKTMKIIVK